MSKYTQRLDDARLAEVLNERGLADLDAIREFLQAAQGGGMLFTEALVSSGLVDDWELSRVVCEIFQLPFLTVDLVRPKRALWDDMGPMFLNQYGLVPLHRFGQLVTVAMPGLVPADVLALLASNSDVVVLPVVGTVQTNRRWILEHASDSLQQAVRSSGWSTMFDEADAAVQMSLGRDDDDEVEIDEAEVDAAVERVAAAVEDVAEELEELGDLEVIDSGEDDDELDPPSLVDVEGERKPKGKGKAKAKGKASASGIDLPPMPEFGG